MTATKTESTKLREILAEKSEELNRLSAAWKTEEKDDSDGGGKVGIKVSPEEVVEYRKILAEAAELRGLAEDAEKAEGIEAFLDAPRGQSFAEVIDAIRAGGQAAGQKAEGPHTPGAAFQKSEAWAEFKAAGGHGGERSWEYQGAGFSDGVIGQKDIFTASTEGVTSLGFGTIEMDAMVPQQQRTTRVRDLFPARPTTANLIEFFRVTGWTGQASANLGMGGPGMVPERSGSVFGLKPGPAGLTFTTVSAPVRTIAWWESVHRNVLDDEPQLQATIDTELLYGLRLQEDYQILNGDGTGENLLGILNTPGIQSYTFGASGVSGEQDADAIRRAMTKSFLSYYQPTGVVVNPADWEQIELIKDSQLRYVVATSVALGATPQVWQTPVVQTPAMPQHTALVGSFGLGAQLYDRQVANIRISENTNDDFLRNTIKVLGEERLCVATKRPESFVSVKSLTP